MNKLVFITKPVQACAKLYNVPDFTLTSGAAITDHDDTVILSTNNETGTLYVYIEGNCSVTKDALLHCMRNILHSRYIRNIAYNEAARSLIHELNQYMRKTDGTEVKAAGGYIYHFQTSILK